MNRLLHSWHKKQMAQLEMRKWFSRVLFISLVQADVNKALGKALYRELIDLLFGLTLRRNAGDEARRYGGLRVNLETWGYLACDYLEHTGVFAFCLH